ncbi:MAG: S8 family serine peptidase [Thiomargarita sp.]|nr:S8 family serine peptidase [Thiomargarita sp.]
MYLNILLIFIFSNFFNICHAERFLIQKAANIHNSINSSIIYDLNPLPWLVIEIPKTRKLNPKIPIYADIKGHFATEIIPPNDPHYSEQWHLEKMGIPSIWEITQGEGVTIALLDSGVDPNHPDLVGNILIEQGYDFGDDDAKPYDANGHGTAMAGLMVGVCNNNEGGCGVAPLAKVIPYKINSQGEDNFSSIDLAVAILAAAGSDAQIISMSLVLDDYAPWVEQALEYAKNKGKLLVAAAGNNAKEVAFPGYLTWVIAVNAVDENGSKLKSSNYGNGLSLTAPGENLLTTLPGTGYTDWYNGSSAAAALTSGVLALLVAQFPTATIPELTLRLFNACQDVNEPGFDEQSGFGQLNMLPNINKSILQLMPTEFIALQPNEILQLDLLINNNTEIMVNLYLRINFPINNQAKRSNLYKIWNDSDSGEKMAYNLHLQSPYKLIDPLFLPLYGTTTAILGTGIIEPVLLAGAYELLALLETSTGLLIQKRKIVWIY